MLSTKPSLLTQPSLLACNDPQSHLLPDPTSAQTSDLLIVMCTLENNCLSTIIIRIEILYTVVVLNQGVHLMGSNRINC